MLAFFRILDGFNNDDDHAYFYDDRYFDCHCRRSADGSGGPTWSAAAAPEAESRPSTKGKAEEEEAVSTRQSRQLPVDTAKNGDTYHGEFLKNQVMAWDAMNMLMARRISVAFETVCAMVKAK